MKESLSSVRLIFSFFTSGKVIVMYKESVRWAHLTGAVLIERREGNRNE